MVPTGKLAGSFALRGEKEIGKPPMAGLRKGRRGRRVTVPMHSTTKFRSLHILPKTEQFWLVSR